MRGVGPPFGIITEKRMEQFVNMVSDVAQDRVERVVGEPILLESNKTEFLDCYSDPGRY